MKQIGLKTREYEEMSEKERFLLEILEVTMPTSKEEIIEKGGFD